MKRSLTAILAVLCFLVTSGGVALPQTAANEKSTLIPYARKAQYGAEVEGITEWAITCSEDWRAAVASGSTFEGESLHLTQNIDMENQTVLPLGNGTVPFKGLLDGHGFSFKNLLVEQDMAKSIHAGLIGYANAATVQNLGLESGLVRAYGRQSAEAKVGGLMGEGDDVTLRRCWTAVTVDSTGTTGDSFQTTSGLARTRGHSVIDSCFSIGAVKGLKYAGTLSGYTQTYTKVWNSFARGTATGEVVSFVRYAGANLENVENSYSVNNNGVFCPKNTAVDTSDFQLSDISYSNGELAWRLNQGMVGETAAYYTVKSGRTVFGTAENQMRRVTLLCEGEEPQYLYAVQGDSVYLNYALGATYESDVKITENRFTMPARDVTVTANPTPADCSELKHVLEYFDGFDYACLKDGQAAKSLVDAVTARLSEGYDDRTAVEADAAALWAVLDAVDPDALPSVTQVQAVPDAFGYTVSSLMELEFVAKHTEAFGARKMLYFTADIPVPKSSAANRLQGLAASLNGLGHTVHGLYCDGNAWLGDYTGKAVRNLNFRRCSAVNQPWQGALLIKNKKGKSLVLENLSFRDCSVSKGAANGLALVVGIQDDFGHTVMRRITVESCALNRSTAAGNSGFLMGREKNGTLLAEDCYLDRNTVTGLCSAGGEGIVFGEVTGTASIKNVGVFNTTVAGGTAKGVLVGAFKNCDSGTSLGILRAENIYSANNNLLGLICQRNATGKCVWNNIYTDGGFLLYSLNGQTIPVENNVTAAESLGGGAYTLNRAGAEKKWEIPAGGTTPVWDTDGKGLPVKVTFRAGGYEQNFYTDTAGHLANLDENLFKYAHWEGIPDLETLKKTVFTADQCFEGQLGETVKVMCQNLCVWGGADKKPYMVQLVDKFKPDIILMQEGKNDWMDYLTKHLKGYSMYYTYRAPDNKEACPVAWKTEKFDLVESGDFWISDTPEVSSKGWDGECYRITTWVVLKSKATGEYIVASSFHLDHVGVEAREKGGPLVYERLREVRERYPGSMFFTAADFNCREGTTAYNALVQENLADVRYEAVKTSFRPTGGNRLSADWSTSDVTKRGDFIMTDITAAKVMEFQILEEIFGKTETDEGTRLSDHNGLLTTVVSLKDPKAFCNHRWVVEDCKNGTHLRRCTAGCGYSEALAHSPRYTPKNGTVHQADCIYCDALWESQCIHEESGTAPTCGDEGTVTRFCVACKHTETETLPATHQYRWDAEKEEYLCGCGAFCVNTDVNGDGATDTADAAALLQYLNEQDVRIDLMAADCRRDNKITVADAVMLLRRL